MFDRLLRLIIELLILLFVLACGLEVARSGLGRINASWPSNPLFLVCAVLFTVGLIVRLERWFEARASDAARRRRLAAGSMIAGAPERVSAKGLPGRPARRPDRRDSSRHRAGS
jgi:hypothetical protein